MPKVKSRQHKPSSSKGSSSSPSGDVDIHAVLRKLADNDAVVREKALRTINQFVSTMRTLDEQKLLRLWKGLFYTVWHSDKPLIQQGLARDLAGMVSRVQSKNLWAFIAAFWTIMMREWRGIDSHRINKYYLLIRFYVAALLQRLADEAWDSEQVSQFSKSLKASVLEPKDAKIPHDVRLHFSDLYLDELEKVKGDADPSELPLKMLIDPVEEYVQLCSFDMCRKAARQNILEDPRLVEWGYKEAPNAGRDAGTGTSSDSEGDWEGFD